MAEKVYELGHGLELWKASINELREQNKNARVMSGDAIQRLAMTIGRDGRLESVPFCALKDNGGKQTIEIVSGHHRVRAAKMAGLEELFVLVDVSNLSRDQIKGKQLAHNSIQGSDDPDTLKEIYETISDIESRLEAFLDSNALYEKLEQARAETVDLGLEYKTIWINLFPSDEALFKKACEQMVENFSLEETEMYHAELERIKLLKYLIRRLGKEYDIHAFGVILGMMSRVCLEYLGQEVDKEWVPLRDIFDVSGVPAETAEIIENAFKGDEPKWKQLQEWAVRNG